MGRVRSIDELANNIMEQEGGRAFPNDREIEIHPEQDSVRGLIRTPDPILTVIVTKRRTRTGRIRIKKKAIYRESRPMDFTNSTETLEPYLGVRNERTKEQRRG